MNGTNSGNFSMEDIYFKDAFTKTGDKLNLEVNDVIIDSIISKNNKFSLDEEGNLIVKTLSTTGGLSNITEIVNLIYPVGCIYISVNNVNPSTLFGGTWEQIKDRFLLACGDTYTSGTIGGEATHTLTISEMPSHGHKATYSPSAVGTGWESYRTGNSTTRGLNDYLNAYTGGGQAHNNMPPYLAVSIWKRIA